MSLEKFFKDDNALILVDTMAKRYGITPYEAVARQTIYEFNFNVAVTLRALEIEADINKEATEQANVVTGGAKGKEEPTLREFGVKRVIRKKAKE